MSKQDVNHKDNFIMKILSIIVLPIFYLILYLYYKPYKWCRNLKNWIKRALFSLSYFIISVMLVLRYWEQIFTSTSSIADYSIYYRLIWTYSAGLLGFSVLVAFIVGEVLAGNNSDDNPFPTYITYYPFIILMTSSITFVIFSLFAKQLGVLFYAASGAMSFIFGHYADRFLSILMIVLERIIKAIKG